MHRILHVLLFAEQFLFMDPVGVTSVLLVLLGLSLSLCTAQSTLRVMGNGVAILPDTWHVELGMRRVHDRSSSDGAYLLLCRVYVWCH